MGLCYYLEGESEDEDDEAGIFFSAKITHNLHKMAKAAGIYEPLWRPDENGYIVAGDIVKVLEAGLEELNRDPDKYKGYNPENGFGNYDGFVSFVTRLLKSCKEHPDAKICADG